MVEVLKRPIGLKIIDQAINATIENSAGDAVIIFPYHGLATGDYIYLTSDIDEYNGFWYVTAIDTNTIKISEYNGADFVEFFQEVDVQYYQTNTHDWNSIFLPIVYKLSNDRWPTNSVDTIRSISSSSDDNGFTRLVLSGNLKASFNALEYVKIVGNSDDVNGVWQIVEVIDLDEIVINLPYDASNTFGTTAIQYYYNNYQTKVKLFAGLAGTNIWQAKKPYEEVAELSLTPDENNIVTFSVAEYIKKKVEVRNNITLFSLPMNIDAFTSFYISFGETYDQSDNYSLYGTAETFEDDTFEGYAVAGKLPFKNIYSGMYSDYVYTSGSPALWLTTMGRLLAVTNRYFDVSFIKNILGDYFVRINKYVSDYLTTIEDLALVDMGMGVYRIPITPDGNYTSFCIQVYRATQAGFVPEVMDDLEDWANLGDPGTEAWSVDGSEIVVDTNALGLLITSDRWAVPYAFEVGRLYSFDYDLIGSTSATIFHIDILDSSDNYLTGTIINTLPEHQTGNYSFVAPTGAAKIAIWFFQGPSCGDPGSGCESRVLSFTNETEPDGAVTDAFPITEEICIDIVEECDIADGFSEAARRLTEGGGFRLLE